MTIVDFFSRALRVAGGGTAATLIADWDARKPHGLADYRALCVDGLGPVCPVVDENIERIMATPPGQYAQQIRYDECRAALSKLAPDDLPTVLIV